MTLSDRLWYYLVPPSKIPPTELLLVGCEIIEAQNETVLLDINDLKKIVFKTCFNSTTTPSILGEHQLDEMVKMVNEHVDTTIGISEVEASSYIILGILCVYFSKVLSKEKGQCFKFSNQVVCARNTQPGQNPSSDSALMVVKVLDVIRTDYPRLVVNEMVPQIIYECKTSVNQNTHSVDSKALVEVLVQAYYCVNFYKLEGLLICLTDLYTWH